MTGAQDGEAGTHLAPMDRSAVLALAGLPGVDLTCGCLPHDRCGCAGLEDLERCPCWDRWAAVPGVLVFHHPDSDAAREQVTLAELAADRVEDHCVPVRVQTRNGPTVVRVAGGPDIHTRHSRAALGHLVDAVAAQMEDTRARETNCGQVLPPAARRAPCVLPPQHEEHNPVCDNGHARWSTLRPVPGPTLRHRRVLTGTLVRVIAAEDSARLDADDVDPAHVWVVIPAWQVRRAVLMGAAPLLHAAGVHDPESLVGIRFLADVLEPLGIPEPQERVHLDNVRVATPPPAEWFPGTD